MDVLDRKKELKFYTKGSSSLGDYLGRRQVGEIPLISRFLSCEFGPLYHLPSFLICKFCYTFCVAGII